MPADADHLGPHPGRRADGARAGDPACVLLDLGLPDAEGYSGVHKMVDAAPDTAVIVLTGRQERDGLGRAARRRAGLPGQGHHHRRAARPLDPLRHRAQAGPDARSSSCARSGSAPPSRRRLERGLLPTPLLRTDAVSCATYYRPGRDHAVLGGDFYDVVETADGRVRAVIGDVMGHGPDEAALGVHLRVAWRTLLLAGVPDEQILPTLDAAARAPSRPSATRYVTVCDVTFDGRRRVTVRVAGHPAPIMCAQGRRRGTWTCRSARRWASRLPGRTPRWPAQPVPVPPGSSLLLYTDGLLDAYAARTADEPRHRRARRRRGRRACSRGDPADVDHRARRAARRASRSTTPPSVVLDQPAPEP